MQIPIELQSEDGRSGVARRVPAAEAHALPREDRALHAARRDRAEAQHVGATTVHSGAQRQDIPVPRGQRLGAGRRAARGARAAAAANAQPLPRQAEGNLQEVPALHRAARRVRVASDAPRRGQPQLDLSAGYLSHRMR